MPPIMHIGINAHLLSGAAGYRSAGIHSYITETLRHLPAVAPRDWRFSVMVGAQYGGSFDGLTMLRSSINTESPVKRILWEQMLQPFSLPRFDVYHAAAFVGPLICPVPSVVTVYDLSFMHYPERLPAARRVYLQRLTGLTCRRARRVIAISHSTAQDLTETLGVPPEKIDIAAPGYDHTRFVPLPDDQIAEFRAAKNLPERFWLFIGTLEPRKNLVTLIEAYAAVPRADRLPLIIGGGKGWDYQPIFDAVARHGLEDEVRFIGFVPAEELPIWYNAAQTFIYPSVFEGFGLPVLEAMACGTPVIIADATSLPEVAGDAGLKVPPTEIDAWRAALITASNDSAWRLEASEQGLREAQRYAWQSTAQVTLASYQQAIAEGT